MARLLSAAPLRARLAPIVAGRPGRTDVSSAAQQHWKAAVSAFTVVKAAAGHRGLVVQHFSFRTLACLLTAALLALAVASSARAATFETTAVLVDGSPVYVNGTPAVGDVNRDGFVDIVAADVDQPRIDVLLGHGDGCFDAPVYFPSAPYQGT